MEKNSRVSLFGVSCKDWVRVFRASSQSELSQALVFDIDWPNDLDVLSAEVFPALLHVISTLHKALDLALEHRKHR